MDDSKRLNEKEKEKLDSLFKALSIVGNGKYIFLCDLKNNVSCWSKTAINYFALPGEYMYDAGNIWEQHIHPDDREKYHDSIAKVFSGLNAGHDMRYRAKNAEGRYVICSCRGLVLADEDGEDHYFGGSITNIGGSDLQDPLTGLRNQYGLFDDLKLMLQKEQPCLIMMVGINSFSQINNVYGYEFGDRLIMEVGARLRDLLCENCQLYHFDGSRFVIVSDRSSVDCFSKGYAKFTDDLANFGQMDGKMLSLSASAGMLILNFFGGDVQSLLSCLNYSFDESKRRRNGDLVIFDNKLDANKKATIDKIASIRACITKNFAGFSLHYQPIVDAESERIVGAEALLRWQNDEYGMVHPNDFIPVLERDNLFPKLGRWILRQALTDAKEFIRMDPDFIININASYSQFEKSNFVADVVAILKETGVSPKNLCIEITERCRLLDLEQLKQITKGLRAMGVRIAMDDFGTGFSSINTLRHISVDIVKIDREFIKNIEEDQRDCGLVRIITELSSVFGAKVCVEGIENERTAEIIRSYGVCCMQGYLFSKPVCFKDFCDLEVRLNQQQK